SHCQACTPSARSSTLSLHDALPILTDLVYVKVASGIGAGIISGGALQRGAQGAAGDLGHVAVPDGNQTLCSCGNLGCLEAVASRSEEHTSELQSRFDIVCRLLLEEK